MKGGGGTWQLPFPEQGSVLLESPPQIGETHLGVTVQEVRSWKCSLWEEPIWELSTMTNQSLPLVEVTLEWGVNVPNFACTWATNDQVLYTRFLDFASIITNLLWKDLVLPPPSPPSLPSLPIKLLTTLFSSSCTLQAHCKYLSF